MTAPPFRDHADGLLIDLVVQPRAKKSRVVGIHGDALKLQLAAPPVDGKANHALVEFLARSLGIPRTDVELCSGERSRRKRVRIRGIDALTARTRLLGA